jgi:hypothetical protein
MYIKIIHGYLYYFYISTLFSGISVGVGVISSVGVGVITSVGVGVISGVIVGVGIVVVVGCGVTIGVGILVGITTFVGVGTMLSVTACSNFAASFSAAIVVCHGLFGSGSVGS